jgi:serine/threonine-protein kinase
MRASAADIAPRPFPERIGRYELLLPLGTGGMATVYLGRVSGPRGFSRDVAVKLMHPHLRDAVEPAVDPLEEAKLAARIRHPNVVPVLDVGDDAFGTYLVMDYVEGDSVAGLCTALARSGRALPLRIALRIICDALAGLHAAHELQGEDGKPLRLVHRDFSPHNILVGIDGNTRLTDFGIAKASGRDHSTEPGLIKGKIRYMSPEQARGAAIDHRADVWAAGVVAWELCAGRRLHRPGEDVEVLLKIVNDDAPALRTARPDVPAAVADVVAEALTRDVDKRLATADRMRKRLLGAGDLADATEVAAFVRAIVEEKLLERRAKVEQVLRLRGEMGALIESSLEPEVSDEAGPGVSVSAPPSRAASPEPRQPERAVEVTDSVAALSPHHARARAQRRWMVIAAAAALVALAGLWLQRWRAVSDIEVPAPVAVATAPAAPAAPPTAVPRSVSISADDAIAQVYLGSRAVTVAPPAREVVVPRTADETGEIQVELVASDGRRVRTTLRGDSEQLGVAFGPPPPTTAPAPTAEEHPPPRPARRAPPASPLATSPYKKKR